MLHTRNNMRPLVRCSLFLLLAAASLAAAEEGKRLALIIGNDAYSVRPLQNAVNDARIMEKALQAAGFRTDLHVNTTKVQMEVAVAKFLAGVGPDDTVLLFYAGHAIQIDSENVLIPVDFQPSASVIEARFSSFSLSNVFQYLARTRLKRAIMIIDACRSNPVAEKHSLQAGLAMPVKAGSDWYIAYSTSPNHVATDNPHGKNSYFTEALADLIPQPGLTIDDVFTRVREKVEQATKGAQTPWSNTSLKSKFYFVPPKDAVVVAEEGLTKKWLDVALLNESRGEWQEALDLFNRIIQVEKSGSLHDAAKARLPYSSARLKAEQHFEKGEYADAAARLEEAYAMEPFGYSAAVEAVNAHLLAENFDRAAIVLRQVRHRAPSAGVAVADAMLKELAAVHEGAAAEVKKGAVAPPAITELFAAHKPGIPDFEAGKAYAHKSRSYDLAALAAQFPPPAPPAVAVASSSPAGTAAPAGSAAAPPQPQTDTPVDLDSLHLEIHSTEGSRDLVQEEFGEIQIGAEQSNTVVLLDGKPVTRALPFKTRVPPGKYRVNLVERGTTVKQQEVEVKSGATLLLMPK